MRKNVYFVIKKVPFLFWEKSVCVFDTTSLYLLSMFLIGLNISNYKIYKGNNECKIIIPEYIASIKQLNEWMGKGGVVEVQTL